HAPTEEARELIAATQGAARRGGVLLDRIASVSGKREMHPVATDLRDFLGGLKTMAAPALPKNFTLETVLNGVHGSIMLDTGGVQDALLNLILNARDAIGHRPGRITISATAVGDTWLDLSVTDTGHGFSDTALKHAMDPFFTTKGAEGSGLGLAMVYDVAKMSGGRVDLANTDTGAQATLRVPLRPADQQCDPMLVLLVEDNDDIRTSVREMLTQLGHNVIEATSADEAQALADLPGLNMVLSDINIRGQRTGVDLLRALDARDHPAHKVLMTSLPAQNPLRQSAADTYSILQKPFTVQSLAGTLSAEATA
ncbi:MAG: ATP-binding protein, partial [Pseudomonadota bacterium]|nr:ATP-binding protein [Pseudomonadota bacterium]